MRSPIRWAKIRKRERRLQRQLDQRARPLVAINERPLIWPDPPPRMVAPRLCAGRITVRERIMRYYDTADAPARDYLASKGWITA